MKIKIVNNYNGFIEPTKFKSNVKILIKVLFKVIKKQNFNKHTFGLILINDIEMEQLNSKYRNKPKTTDVLSFPGFSNDYDMGDIFISVDQVKRQFHNYAKSFDEELFFLITHGVLHLLGYDHEVESEALVMKNIEKDTITNFYKIINKN